MDKAQRTQKWAYDQHCAQDQGFKVGDEVWLDAQDLSTDWPSPKLDVLRHGPFRVQQVMGPLTYRLELPPTWRVNDVFHWSKLHPVAQDEVEEQVNAPPPDIRGTEVEQHVVDEVVNTRWTQGHFKLRV
jgi:hypothetical protein